RDGDQAALVRRSLPRPRRGRAAIHLADQGQPVHPPQGRDRGLRLRRRDREAQPGQLGTRSAKERGPYQRVPTALSTASRKVVRARAPWPAGMSAAACPLDRRCRAGSAETLASTSSTSLLASAASVSAWVSVLSVSLLAS